MKSKNSRAFSLLEIVIAMLIIGLVVAGLFGLFVTSHGFIGNAGRRLQAIQYARRVAENLKVYVSASNTPPVNAGTGPGAALDGGIDKNPVALLGLPAINIPGATGTTCTYSVIENADVNFWSGGVEIADGPTDLEAVTVTVQWNEP